MQLYLLLGAVITRSPPRQLTTLMIGLAAFAVALRAVLALASPEGGFAAYLLLPTRMDAPVLGCLAAIAVRDAGTVAAQSRVRAQLWLLIAALVAVVVAICAAGMGIGSPGMNLAGHLLLSAAASLTIFLLATTDAGAIRRLLEWRPLTALGIVSYAVYVFHQPISGLAHQIAFDQPPRISNLAQAGVTLLAVIVTFAIAALSWKVFEGPIIRLSRRLA
jgi:peptidoglycan/LPS O-acetylase OafA/YrhL